MNTFQRLSLASALLALSSPVQAKEIFVRWRSEDVRTQQALHARLQGKVVWRSALVKGLERVDVADESAALRAYAAETSVMYAEPNYRVRRILPQMETLITTFEQGASDDTPNDPYYRRQWALTGQYGIHPQEAWQLTQGSKDIRVAVIDTGVDASHPELSDRVVAGYDFIDKTDRVTDHHGHGTHVSGIIGARTNNKVGIAGINPSVTIVPIRAVPSDGDETDADVISSFEFAVKSGARVANCSFGKEVESQAVGDTIAAAGEQGLFVAVAAGNDGEDNNQSKNYPANFRTPNMIAVASNTDDGDLSYFSNFGMNMVDLAAPGSSIMSTIPGGRYASWDGTSMATPQVAGVAALVLSANPALSVAKLREILMSTVSRVPALQGKLTTGGIIDATAAVKAALALKN